MYPGANNHILFIFWNAEVGLFSIIYTANKGYVIKAAKAIYHHVVNEICCLSCFKHSAIFLNENDIGTDQ